MKKRRTSIGYGHETNVVINFPEPFPGIPKVIIGNAAVVKDASVTTTGFISFARHDDSDGRNAPYIAIYFPS